MFHKKRECCLNEFLAERGGPSNLLQGFGIGGKTDFVAEVKRGHRQLALPEGISCA